MTEQPLEHRLAEYLGGEMPDDERSHFEAALAHDPALRAEVESLRQTLTTLESVDEIRPDAHGMNVDQSGRSWRSWGYAVLRYAAIIGVAFVIGRLSVPLHSAPPAQPPVDRPAGQKTRSPGNTRPWLQRAAEVYVSRPNEPAFGRSLLALAHSDKDDTRHETNQE